MIPSEAKRQISTFPHTQIIERSLPELVEALPLRTSTIWERLVAKKVFSIGDLQEIRDKKAGQRDQARALLRRISKGSPSHYLKLREALVEAGEEHIVQKWLPLPDDPMYDPSLKEMISQEKGNTNLLKITNEFFSGQVLMGETGIQNKQRQTFETETESDRLMVTFDRDEGKIIIEKKDGTFVGKPILLPDSWRELQKSIKPAEVECIWIGTVNIGESCGPVFGFLYYCSNLTQLCIDKAKDNSGDNRELATALASTLPELGKLRWIYMGKTYFGLYGRKLFQSLNGRKLRILELMGTNISGCGAALGSCLSRLPELMNLALNDCGLSPEDIVGVVACLSYHCKKLLMLRLDFNTLQSKGKGLVPYIANLSSLKFFSLGHCYIPQHILCDVITKTSPNIEALQLVCNDEIFKVFEQIFLHVLENPRLRFLHFGPKDLQSISEEQKDSLAAVLRSRGGNFETEHDGDNCGKSYNELLRALRFQCEQGSTELDTTTDDDRIEVKIAKCSEYGTQVFLMIQKNDWKFIEYPAISVAIIRKIHDRVIPAVIYRVILKKINVTHCHKELFEYLAACVNVVQFCIFNIEDGTSDNSAMSTSISKALPSLKKINWFYLRDTFMGWKGKELLDSLQCPLLQVLELMNNSLHGCGTALESSLSRIDSLKWLGLQHCGLAEKELVSLIIGLSKWCPQLVALMLHHNNLIGLGEILSGALSQLQMLQLLGVEGCNIQEQTLVQVFKGVCQRVKVLEMKKNASLSPVFQKVFACAKQHPNLLFIRLDPNQLNPVQTAEMHALLVERGGALEISQDEVATSEAYKMLSDSLRDQYL